MVLKGCESSEAQPASFPAVDLSKTRVWVLKVAWLVGDRALCPGACSSKPRLAGPCAERLRHLLCREGARRPRSRSCTHSGDRAGRPRYPLPSAGRASAPGAPTGAGVLRGENHRFPNDAEVFKTHPWFQPHFTYKNKTEQEMDLLGFAAEMNRLRGLEPGRSVPAEQVGGLGGRAVWGACPSERHSFIYSPCVHLPPGQPRRESQA